MKRTCILVATLIFVTLDARALELYGTADRIVDGDTLWVCDQAACHKIRLCGVNAPEKGAGSYHDSKAALADLIKGKNVCCLQVSRGTPCDGRSKPINRDRIVAQCFVGDLDIAGALVASGLACDWVKFSGGVYARDANGKACP